MPLYPVFLNLRDAVCLVVGAGAVGCRRVSSLLEAGARVVRLVDPVLATPPATAPEHLTRVLTHPAVCAHGRAFVPEDVTGCTLVCAATDTRTVNAAVAAVCRTACIPCVVADAPETGTCLIPAQMEQSGVHLALTTGGASPAMAARIKTELADWLTDRYDQQLALLAALRPLVLKELAVQKEWTERAEQAVQTQRADVFRQLASAELGEALHRGDYAACDTLLRAALPPALHIHIAELLHELA